MLKAKFVKRAKDIKKTGNCFMFMQNSFFLQKPFKILRGLNPLAQTDLVFALLQKQKPVHSKNAFKSTWCQKSAQRALFGPRIVTLSVPLSVFTGGGARANAS
jgi:hypothetical protein